MCRWGMRRVRGAIGSQRCNPVAHALLRAASSSLDALAAPEIPGIEMSLDAARMSACATVGCLRRIEEGVLHGGSTEFLADGRGRTRRGGIGSSGEEAEFRGDFGR